MVELIILLQGRYSFHDSTEGTGPGFGWFVAAVFIFLTVGVLKAFWDDKGWRGRAFPLKKKPKDLKYRSGRWIQKDKLHATPTDNPKRYSNFED